MEEQRLDRALVAGSNPAPGTSLFAQILRWAFCPLCGAAWRPFWGGGSVSPLLEPDKPVLVSRSVGCTACWGVVLRQETKLDDPAR